MTSPSVRAPGSTYRVQFNPSFRFVDGRDLVPYLSDLGITDLYSSPWYKPRRGSSHGYDIANPLRVNPELGTEEDFDDMASRLQHYSMGLLLDTVPNHMAASYENPWWTDVLENGPASAFAVYFDIDWHPATTKASFLQENRVLLPILGELYGDALAAGRFSLKFEDTGMHVRYYDTRLPLDPKTYTTPLARAASMFPEVAGIAAEFDRLPSRDEEAPDRILERRRNKDQMKEQLWRACQANPEIKRVIDESLQEITQSPADLDRLLSAQAYRLAYWKIGYEEINYRRFFDINELVGLRIELPEVFSNRNQKTLELVRSGKVTGLRIDHIDGLWDPGCYLNRMTQAADGGKLYVVVEKILGRDEDLPREWPVSGTTGYEFLNALNGIFVDPEGLARLEEIYSRHSGNYLPFAEISYQCNRLVMQNLFTGDVNALAHHLGALAARHRHARDVRLSELTDALVEVTACLPVYRTYIHNLEVSDRDRAYIEETVALARRRTSPEQISDAAFAFLRCVLLLDPPDYLEQYKRDWLQFVMRWQQFSGPVMAKGLEDTASYRHNSLISLNEVGSDPVRENPPYSLEDFHQLNVRRLEQWPATLNATATHDTKRGEDVRARLNVLSEIPQEWERSLDLWMGWNADKKAAVNGILAPSAGEEILLYQTLLGAWPVSAERLHEFICKSLREAKQHSSWLAPQEPYEKAVMEFTDRILADEEHFLPDFRRLQEKLAKHGARNSLGQVLLKICAPGIPDFFQGCEVWQFSLVDPDNRRPVDYKRHIEMLDSLRRRETEDRIALIRALAANPQQDEMKLFVTHKALQFRKSHAELFAQGEYLPLDAGRDICAFARHLGNRWVAVVAPRWTTRLNGWGDVELPLPPLEWTDVITGLIPPSLRVADVLSEFPVAMLAG